ncbi:T-lymphocyte activation antigen CD86 isoform X1 [Microcebus murinus]|uniref:T-lymphocyte activation antigen CD86 isoform X1 n=1 Tax=Microcebus murinus TaxID=30608 RepID=UPI003F6BDFEE
MFVDGAVFGGFLRALHSLSEGAFVVIFISGNAHLPAEVIWKQVSTLALSAVVFLFSQFPFLYASSSLSPEVVFLSTRSFRRHGEHAKAPFGLFLVPRFHVPRECCCASSLKIKAYFNETADLPCPFTNSQNLSMSELVVFWQNQEASVLYELYLGKEKPDNVNRKYMGRTSFDRENWTLRLHNVQIKDQGSYQCFIHHKKPKGMILIYQMNSDLSVLANFSQPEIIEISNITENLYRNLTCSSIQGYPEPKKMSFWLKTENSTTVDDGVMHKSQDNVTELYNVSISLSVSLSAVTSNMTIICVLQTEPMKTELFSSPFYIDPKDPQLQPPDYTVWIATAIAPLAIGLLLITYLIRQKRKKKRQPGVSNECEILKMERGESEQTQKRVNIHVPKRSDEEFQCVVNSLEITSGDKSATHF